jgi:predicted nucleic-acid-binding Zn-ribbon protein
METQTYGTSTVEKDLLHATNKRYFMITSAQALHEYTELFSNFTISTGN